MTIRDDTLWVKHIDGDPEIVRRILALPADAPMTLMIEDRRIHFRKMRDGTDGRPTPGLRPHDEDRALWNALQGRRGESLPFAEASADPYLVYLDDLFSEWNTSSDAEAFDDL